MECPQYIIRLEVVRYLCTSCLLPLPAITNEQTGKAHHVRHFYDDNKIVFNIIRILILFTLSIVMTISNYTQMTNQFLETTEATIGLYSAY